MLSAALGRAVRWAALPRVGAVRSFSACSEEAQQHVMFADQPNLRIVTLNRPQALNALTLPMVRRLTRLLLQWEKNSAVGARDQ